MGYLTAICVFLLPLLLWLIKKYVYEPSQYWKKAGVPYVSALYFPVGIFRILTNPLHEVALENYKKYGRFYGSFNFLTPNLVVAEPDIIKDILVKDFPTFPIRMKMPKFDPTMDNMLSVVEGEQWKRIRTIISPAFSTGKIKNLASIFIDCARTTGKNFEEASGAGKPIDVKRIFAAFMMDIILSSAFGIKIDSQNDSDNIFVVEAKRCLSQIFSLKGLCIEFLARVFKFLGCKGTLEKSMAFFKQATIEIIKERRRTGKTRNDFLQLLMEAADGEEKSIQQKEKDHPNCDDGDDDHVNQEGSKLQKSTHNYKGLNDDELMAQCVAFLTGGYETSSSTLSYAAYNLAINPECQERLIAEVDEVLRHNGNQLTYEGVQEMKYLDNVISETLRLFPLGVALPRQAEADYTLKNTNIVLKKGCIVYIPVYAMHIDSEFFPDPERFDPDRFTPEEKAKRSQYTYLPFGAGPRNCIAMRFAITIMKYCLAYLMSQFRFKRCEATEVPLKYPKRQLMITVKEINLAIEKRTDRVSVLV